MVRGSTVWHAVMLLIAVLLGGCAVAPLDRTGAIRASEGDAGCPTGYEVRWGRCCPADASLATCPASVQRDPTGSLFAPVGCTCPAGFEARGNVCCLSGSNVACSGLARRQFEGCSCPNGYELRFNACCPADSGPECPPGAIGSPCRVNEDCHLPIGANGLLAPFCLLPPATSALQLPDGYCSVVGCMNAGDCGPDGACLHVALDPSNPATSTLRFCLRGCTIPPTQTYAACPQTNGEYACWVAPDVGTRISVCLPDCVLTPGVCTGGAVCAPDTHSCVVPCMSLTDAAMCQRAGYVRCNVAARRCEL